MENKSYIKNIIKVLIWPIMYIVGQIFIEYIFVAIFNSREKGNLSNSEFLKYVETSEYINKLNNYINSKLLLISILTFVVFFPIFLKKYRKYIQKSNIKLTNIFEPILFGISISFIFNICVFNINNIIDIGVTQSSLPIFIQLICSGLIGPILEELLFRGIIYNKLKSFNKNMSAILICSMIFAIFHFDVINCIYAFGVSFIFIYLYEKYKSIKMPILMHITLNFTTILTYSLIAKSTLIFNLFIIIINLIIIIWLRYFLNNKKY